MVILHSQCKKREPNRDGEMRVRSQSPWKPAKTVVMKGIPNLPVGQKVAEKMDRDLNIGSLKGVRRKPVNQSQYQRLKLVTLAVKYVITSEGENYLLCCPVICTV